MSENSISYADVMRSCQQNLNLNEYGISNVCLRRAVTGASILQIPEYATADKADMLAEGLQGIPEDLDSREVRINNLSHCRIAGAGL